MKNALLCLHLVAVISWMAGVLYGWRLLVYHAEEAVPVVRARLAVMERRLYRAITIPAMTVAVLAGAGMVALDPRYYLRAHWLHAKLALVVGMIASTLSMGANARRLAATEAPEGSRRYRVLNEVPTLLLIAIVILVVVKPF